MNSSINILVVDDNPENLKVVSNILKNKGYKIALALNGKSAFEILAKYPIDLILLDIMMPEMDGYEVCRLMKENEKFRDIPILFLSALNETSDIVKAFSAGAVDYVSKPFQMEELTARVATHIKISQQNQILKAQSQELQKLNADKDRFITILAHDLKSPFNTILGFLSLLTKNVRKYDADKIDEQLSYIQGVAQNTFKLLEDILTWVRSNAGKLPFAPQQVNLTTLCQSVIENLQLQAHSKNITIDQVATADQLIFADKDMIHTVLRNLVSNAIKYTKSGGGITISAQQDNDNTTITVSDNGVGMTEQQIKKLFDISEKISTEGTDNEPGTGFGLMLCKDFVERHGGKIWVNSEVGKGSDIIFTLPKKANLI